MPKRHEIFQNAPCRVFGGKKWSCDSRVTAYCGGKHVQTVAYCGGSEKQIKDNNGKVWWETNESCHKSGNKRKLRQKWKIMAGKKAQITTWVNSWWWGDWHLNWLVHHSANYGGKNMELWRTRYIMAGKTWSCDGRGTKWREKHGAVTDAAHYGGKTTHTTRVVPLNVSRFSSLLVGCVLNNGMKEKNTKKSTMPFSYMYHRKQIRTSLFRASRCSFQCS